MSNVGLSMESATGGGSGQSQGPRKPRRSGGAASKVALAVTAVIVLGVLGVIGWGGYQVFLKLEQSVPAADFSGPGKGTVIIEIQKGQDLGAIGVTLKDAGVVAGTEAFNAAANSNPEATSITPGSYAMKKRMAAEAAVTRLLDPKARNEFIIVVQAGWRTDQIVEHLTDITGLREGEFWAAIRSPRQVPVPRWGKGRGDARVEGFLFPASYTFRKDNKDAAAILNAMIDRFEAFAQESKFVKTARDGGHDPYEVLNVASLVQAEGNGEDYREIAGAIYNRLDPNKWGGTFNLLQIDATLNYIFKSAELNFTDEQKQNPSPYNTYVNRGLPPTPINNPSESAMKAALDPKESRVLYWAHGRDGNTCYATNLRDHINNYNGPCAQ